MSAVQSGKFVGITSFEQDGKRSHARFMRSMNLCAVWPRGTIHGILNRSQT